jgi:hypothetical protein
MKEGILRSFIGALTQDQGPPGHAAQSESPLYDSSMSGDISIITPARKNAEALRHTLDHLERLGRH